MNALAGDNMVEADSLEVGAIQLLADGGDSDDVLIGGDSNDILLGGAGALEYRFCFGNKRHLSLNSQESRIPGMLIVF